MCGVRKAWHGRKMSILWRGGVWRIYKTANCHLCNIHIGPREIPFKCQAILEQAQSTLRWRIFAKSYSICRFWLRRQSILETSPRYPPPPPFFFFFCSFSPLFFLFFLKSYLAKVYIYFFCKPEGIRQTPGRSALKATHLSLLLFRSLFSIFLFLSSCLSPSPFFLSSE